MPRRVSPTNLASVATMEGASPIYPGTSLRSESSPPTTLVESPARRHSAQLSHWSRIRALRAGRRLNRLSGANSSSPLSSPSNPSTSKLSAVQVVGSVGDDDGDDEGSAPGRKEGNGGYEKVIYMISDGTGSTLEHSLGTALCQFDNSRTCTVNTRLYSGINDVDKLLDIIRQAAKEEALVLYTLANPTMAKPAKQACQMWNIPFVDILGPTTEAIASQLGMTPSGISRCERNTPLTGEYFKRVEAIEFTVKLDDGAQPQSLKQAQMVIVGVSRSGKTPLSIYLAQKGYKVANVPIVMGVDLPKSLFQISQEKIFALIISPTVLHAIRTSRAKSLGFDGQMENNYSVMEHVRHELDFASRLYKKNPLWPVIDVTGKAIEEIAAVVIRTYHDRKQKGSKKPGIVKIY